MKEIHFPRSDPLAVNFLTEKTTFSYARQVRKSNDRILNLSMSNSITGVGFVREKLMGFKHIIAIAGQVYIGGRSGECATSRSERMALKCKIKKT